MSQFYIDQFLYFDWIFVFEVSYLLSWLQWLILVKDLVTLRDPIFGGMLCLIILLGEILESGWWSIFGFIDALLLYATDISGSISFGNFEKGFWFVASSLPSNFINASVVISPLELIRPGMKLLGASLPSCRKLYMFLIPLSSSLSNFKLDYFLDIFLV